LNESPPAGGTIGSTNKRFTSYDRSANTGLDYAINRHYDPQQGRFTQVDPIGMGSVSLDSPQTLNLYAYCTNDPINHADPSGLGFFSFLKKLLNRVVNALIHAVITAVFTFLQTFLTTGNLHAALVAGAAAGVAGFLKQLGWPSKGFWISPGGTPQWNPNAVAILGGGPSGLSRYIIVNFTSFLQKPGPGSFYDCLYSSGLAKTHAKGQYADAKLFNQAAADLLLEVHNAEGTSLSLLGVTLMNENTTFNLMLGPNTNSRTKTEWWDVGPFQINQHYTNQAIANGVSNARLAYWDIYGPTVSANGSFTGSPVANGQMAARRLQAAGNTDRARAVNYAGNKNGPARGRSYDSFAPLFDKFFNCYRR
jgi:RHS repeat-associated protein